VDNREVAEQLRQFADLLEIKGENAFRVNAYRRAADAVEREPEPLEAIIAREELTAIEGIGPGLAAAITEIVQTGRYSATEELLDEVPGTLLTLLGIPGVGPKTVGRLYRELGITTLVQLEAAARAGQVRQLKGFGPRAEARILEGIAFLHRRTNRLSIGTADPVARRLVEHLRRELGVPVEIAGSVRRQCETVGNIDLLAAVESPAAIAPALESAPRVTQIEEVNDAFVVAALEIGSSVRVVAAAPAVFGTELVRWTGSRAHVAELVRVAGGTLPHVAEEAEVYAALGLPWIAPELREARGEIAAAQAGRLPRLIEVSDLRGDLHLHSEWSDGRATILQLAEAARDRGYEYLCIADHSGGLRVARGLDVDRLREQWHEIERVNELVPEVRLLRASEVEVRRDGSLDFPDEILAEFDLVVASLHSGLRQPREELMKRILGVLRNPHVDIVAHPTGRIIERRPGAEYDWEEVFRVARETGTAIEINADPARLDMNDEHARMAQEAGVLIAIDSDAHDIPSLDHIRYGVSVARRAWIGPESVVNTRPLPDLLAWLNR